MAKNEINYEEDLDQINFNNYKGMFFQDAHDTKYQDLVTGAHFEYKDMCRRLAELGKSQRNVTKQKAETEENAYSSSSPSEIEDDSVNSRQPIHESRSAFKAIKSFCILQQQDGRNTVAQPSQGFTATKKTTKPERNCSIIKTQYNAPAKSKPVDQKPTFEKL